MIACKAEKLSLGIWPKASISTQSGGGEMKEGPGGITVLHHMFLFLIPPFFSLDEKMQWIAWAKWDIKSHVIRHHK